MWVRSVNFLSLMVPTCSRAVFPMKYDVMMGDFLRVIRKDLHLAAFRFSFQVWDHLHSRFRSSCKGTASAEQSIFPVNFDVVCKHQAR